MQRLLGYTSAAPSLITLFLPSWGNVPTSKPVSCLSPVTPSDPLPTFLGDDFIPVSAHPALISLTMHSLLPAHRTDTCHGELGTPHVFLINPACEHAKLRKVTQTFHTSDTPWKFSCLSRPSLCKVFYVGVVMRRRAASFSTLLT
ncbi:hypothetical protein DENSPDRAFT_62980 [Dentipellis sp. KUC8613]|nr:hypothetical protein DENSPDRAFT_62980 [Dentipellis sp. KUC8613]